MNLFNALNGPCVKSDPDVQHGTMYLLALRKPNETDEEWAKRCCMIYNIGVPVKDEGEQSESV